MFSLHLLTCWGGNKLGNNKKDVWLTWDLGFVLTVNKQCWKSRSPRKVPWFLPLKLSDLFDSADPARWKRCVLSLSARVKRGKTKAQRNKPPLLRSAARCRGCDCAVRRSPGSAVRFIYCVMQPRHGSSSTFPFPVLSLSMSTAWSIYLLFSFSDSIQAGEAKIKTSGLKFSR